MTPAGRFRDKFQVYTDGAATGAEVWGLYQSWGGKDFAEFDDSGSYVSHVIIRLQGWIDLGQDDVLKDKRTGSQFKVEHIERDPDGEILVTARGYQKSYK